LRHGRAPHFHPSTRFTVGRQRGCKSGEYVWKGREPRPSQFSRPHRGFHHGAFPIGVEGKEVPRMDTSWEVRTRAVGTGVNGTGVDG